MIMSKKYQMYFLLLVFIIACGQFFFEYHNTSTDSSLLSENDVLVTEGNAPNKQLHHPKRLHEILRDLPTHWKRIKLQYVAKRTIFYDFIDKVQHSKCYQDIKYSLEALFSGEMWAIKMVDAYGKPGDGVFDGNVRWLGSYDECRNIHVPIKNHTELERFHGQYCILDIPVEGLNQVVPFSLGICVPDSCNFDKIGKYGSNLITSFKDILPFPVHLHTPIYIKKVTCHPVSKEWTPQALVVIGISFVFILLAIIGSCSTALEYFKRNLKNDDPLVYYTQELNCFKKSQYFPVEKSMDDADFSSSCTKNVHIPEKTGYSTDLQAFFNCFCCFTNSQKLLSIKESEILFLHGLRCLSFFGVVLIHTLANTMYLVDNIMETADIIGGRIYQPILGGHIAIDAFLFLSGFLVAHTYFNVCQHTDGKISWFFFYMHRYIRITPTYMIIFGIIVTLSYYMGSGPFWTVEEIYPMCEGTWWWNMLYLNNILETKCMGWSWYLALDMQFYIMSPLFLITLWRWPKVGYSLLILFISVGLVINFSITYTYRLVSTLGNAFPLTVSLATVQDNFRNFYNKIHTKPYARMNPYLIGIAVAHILFKSNPTDQRKPISECISFFGWILSTVAFFTGIFFWYQRKDDLILNSLFNAVIYTINAFVLGWTVYACWLEKSGAVKSILSCKIFVPLSRLTYSAYLIHYMVIMVYMNSLRRPIHFSGTSLVIMYLGLLVETYFFSFIVHLLFEAPIVRLERFMRSKLRL